MFKCYLRLSHLFAWAVFAAGITFSVQAAYKPIVCSSISEVKKHLTPGCLFVSDFDNTLVKEPQDFWGKTFYWASLYNPCQRASALEFIEPLEVRALLNYIEDAHTNFIVLTARSSFTIKQTFSQLENMVPNPLTFAQFHLGPSALTLTLEKGCAYYRDAIAFCCYKSKGEVLSVLLRELKLKPEKVVFIDDKEEHVIDVARAMENLEIPFEGLCYVKKSV